MKFYSRLLVVCLQVGYTDNRVKTITLLTNSVLYIFDLSNTGSKIKHVFTMINNSFKLNILFFKLSEHQVQNAVLLEQGIPQPSVKLYLCVPMTQNLITNSLLSIFYNTYAEQFLCLYHLSSLGTSRLSAGAPNVLMVCHYRHCTLLQSPKLAAMIFKLCFGMSVIDLAQDDLCRVGPLCHQPCPSRAPDAGR